MLAFLLIGGMFVLFVRGDRQCFSLFFFSWFGLGWYRMSVETPQEDICFFLGIELGLRGGGENGGREFSCVVWSGARENSVLLLQIQKKLTKIWKFSPNSKKPKIGQKILISVLDCKCRQIIPEIGNNHQTIETTNLKRIGNFCFILQIRKELTKKIENFHQLFKPQNLKQLKNYVLLLQIQGENDKKMEIFTELSKP